MILLHRTSPRGRMASKFWPRRLWGSAGQRQCTLPWGPVWTHLLCLWVSFSKVKVPRWYPLCGCESPRMGSSLGQLLEKELQRDTRDTSLRSACSGGG
jgi:hypothetical protein